MVCVRKLFVFLFLLTSAVNAGILFDSAELSLPKEVMSGFEEELRDLRIIPKSGKAVASFYKKKRKAPYLKISYHHGNISSREYDLNEDGFFEIVKRKVENKDFIYEELYQTDSGEAAYHFRKRFYLTSEEGKLKRVVEFREKKKLPFRSIEVRLVANSNYYQEDKQCFDYPKIPITDIPNIDEIIDDLNINWAPTLRRRGKVKYKVQIEKSCDQNVRSFLSDNKVSFKDIYGETIEKGLRCLQDLANKSTENAGVRLLFINSIASLVGQQVYLNPRRDLSLSLNKDSPLLNREENDKRNVSIICSQNDIPNDYDGIASTGKTFKASSIQCEEGALEIKHPYISLNFKKLNKKSVGSLKDLQKLIFHEFLHTTGWDHDDFWDPIDACAKVCFLEPAYAEEKLCKGDGGAAYMTPEGVEAATGLLLKYYFNDKNRVRTEFRNSGLPERLIPDVLQNFQD